MIVIYYLGKKKNVYLNYAILWLTPVLLTPYIILYDMLLLIIPISFLVPFLEQDPILQAGVGILWFILLITPIINIAYPITFSALLLFFLCAYRLVKPLKQPGVSFT